MAIYLVTNFLIGCKKEKEAPASQPVNEASIAIDSAPVAAESPALDNTTEEISGRLFPKSALANGKTTEYGTTDFVDFDDETALTLLPGYAAQTFATAPFYIQKVGTAWVRVRENNSGNYKPAFMSDYEHYHLSYQNFEPCLKPDGKFGKPIFNVCTPFDPVKEPRVLNTHAGDHWIKIHAYDYSTTSRVFDMLSIQVTHGPIQLWFKKSNGEWWHWGSIATGTRNFGTWCTSITEVLISSTGNQGPVGFDNVKVFVPTF